jgi:hypothetical protein
MARAALLKKLMDGSVNVGSSPTHEKPGTTHNMKTP